ncbi:MAG: hypothetical protein AAGN35_27500 [Bacteroidota bacterium]
MNHSKAAEVEYTKIVSKRIFENSYLNGFHPVSKKDLTDLEIDWARIDVPTFYSHNYNFYPVLHCGYLFLCSLTLLRNMNLDDIVSIICSIKVSRKRFSFAKWMANYLGISIPKILFERGYNCMGDSSKPLKGLEKVSFAFFEVLSEEFDDFTMEKIGLSQKLIQSKRESLARAGMSKFLID